MKSSIAEWINNLLKKDKRYIQGTGKKTEQNPNWSKKFLHSICSRSVEINSDCTKWDWGRKNNGNQTLAICFVLLHWEREGKERRKMEGQRGKSLDMAQKNIFFFLFTYIYCVLTWSSHQNIRFFPRKTQFFLKDKIFQLLLIHVMTNDWFKIPIQK